MFNRKERELRKWIKRQLDKGKTKEEVTEALKKIGWQEETINKSIERLMGKIIEIKIPIPIAKEEVAESKPSEDKKIGLTQRLSEIDEKLDIITQKKKLEKLKPFRLPFRVRSQLKNLAKKNKLLVFMLKQDRTIQPFTAKVQDNILFIGDKMHNCSTDFIYLWQGKTPAIVLPEWDLNPIGTKDYYDAVKDGRLIDPQTRIIQAMEYKENLQPKKMSGNMIIWIIIGIIAFIGIFMMGGIKK